MNHDVGDERRREARPCSDPGEDPSISNAALAHRDPARDKSIGCRIDYRLTSSEEEAHSHKQQEGTPGMRGHERREGGKDSPPHHSRSHDPAGTEAIRKAAPNGLKQRVADQQCAEDLAALHIAQMVGISNRTSGDGNVDAVEVRHGAQDEEPKHQKPAHSGCGISGHELVLILCAYAECSRRILDSCSATILSSPACSMKEFIVSPGLPSPCPMTIAGFAFLNCLETC